MKRILTSSILLTCCAGAVYAGTPRQAPPPDLAPVTLQTAGADRAYLDPAMLNSFRGFTPQQPRDSHEDLARLAYKISYVGTILLTADHLVRSVDSVLDSMKLTRDDGTRMVMLMEPRSRGFEVMIKLSRPIDF